MTKPDTNAPKKTTSSTIWGGRFAGGPSQLMTDINASISYDKVMYKQDIAGSLARSAINPSRKPYQDRYARLHAFANRPAC